jgi:hypothetical protein
MHSSRVVLALKGMKGTAATWHARKVVFPLGVVCLVVTAGACGSDLPGRYYGGPGRGADGSLCGSYGRSYSCACVDEPITLEVSLLLGANAGLTDLDIQLFRQAAMGVSPSASPPAKGSPGANGYFVASLRDDGGDTLSSLVFADPRLASGDAGYLMHAKTRFTIELVPRVSSLHIENWDTGQTLVDLDLRGHLQLLCFDLPCLSICPATPASADASIDVAATETADGSGPVTVVDAGVVDAGAILFDGN